MKKARQPVLYVFSSLASFLVDIGAYYLLQIMFRQVLGPFAETVCTFGARAVSSFFNFNVNRLLVFQNRSSHYGKALFRYYALAIPQAAVSAILVSLFANLLHAETAGLSTAVKTAVDTCLFVISFFIQKYWVFSNKTN